MARRGADDAADELGNCLYLIFGLSGTRSQSCVRTPALIREAFNVVAVPRALSEMANPTNAGDSLENSTSHCSSLLEVNSTPAFHSSIAIGLRVLFPDSSQQLPAGSGHNTRSLQTSAFRPDPGSCGTATSRPIWVGSRRMPVGWQRGTRNPNANKLTASRSRPYQSVRATKAVKSRRLSPMSLSIAVMSVVKPNLITTGIPGTVAQCEPSSQPESLYRS